MKGKVFLSFNSAFKRYLNGVLLKLCILVYNLEITTIRRDFNFDKVYALFSVSSFSHETMVV